MLVFSRKIGQQVVLPEQGITIDVMSAGKARVRLGISAPADIPVHRGEVWDRAQGIGNESSASSDKSPDRLAADEPQSPPMPSPSIAELDQCLAQWITRRTGDRITELSVERLNGRIVIRGSARSHYVRRLVQTAVSDFLNACGRISPSSVECNIEVAQVYWRSVGHTRGLARLPEAQQ
jgi:carbon storage regulator